MRIVRETEKSIAQVARDLGIKPQTLGNWAAKDEIARGEVEGPLCVMSSNDPWSSG
ncbi:MAG: transposase [Acidimicrobiia bacterium]|nr:transposase [Acidimicrobiia bacterium]